jgi:hypothetical protein
MESVLGQSTSSYSAVENIQQQSIVGKSISQLSQLIAQELTSQTTNHKSQTTTTHHTCPLPWKGKHVLLDNTSQTTHITHHISQLTNHTNPKTINQHNKKSLLFLPLSHTQSLSNNHPITCKPKPKPKASKSKVGK